MELDVGHTPEELMQRADREAEKLAGYIVQFMEWDITCAMRDGEKYCYVCFRREWYAQGKDGMHYINKAMARVRTAGFRVEFSFNPVDKFFSWVKTPLPQGVNISWPDRASLANTGQGRCGVMCV